MNVFTQLGVTCLILYLFSAALLNTEKAKETMILTVILELAQIVLMFLTPVFFIIGVWSC